VVRQGKIGFPKRDPATGMMANQHLGTSDVTKLKVYLNSLSMILSRAEF